MTEITEKVTIMLTSPEKEMRNLGLSVMKTFLKTEEDYLNFVKGNVIKLEFGIPKHVKKELRRHVKGLNPKIKRYGILNRQS